MYIYKYMYIYIYRHTSSYIYMGEECRRGRRPPHAMRLDSPIEMFLTPVMMLSKPEPQSRFSVSAGISCEHFAQRLSVTHKHTHTQPDMNYQKSTLRKLSFFSDTDMTEMVRNDQKQTEIVGDCQKQTLLHGSFEQYFW